MNRKIALFAVAALSLAACNDAAGQNNKQTQAALAKQAANSIVFTDNAEIENVKKRIELTANPGLMGFIVLLNESGQPIVYEGVRGKITSGAKRLTEPDRSGAWGSGANNVVRAAPSDEGTYGTSGEYIFYWTQNGEYRQWNGKYLYSDKPLRLSVQPLVVSVQQAATK